MTDTTLLSAVAAPIAASFGLLVAYLVVRTRVPGRVVYDYVTMLGAAAPGIVLGLGILLHLGLVAAAYWLGWSIFSDPESDLLTPTWLQDMSSRMQFAQQRLLPSWWLSAGLLEASRPEFDAADRIMWAQSVLFLVLLVANALFFQQVALWAASRWLRDSYQRLQTESVVRRRGFNVAWVDQLTSGLAAFLPAPMRLMIVKDLRLFRRDPLQWSQFAIFFGLLVLYFLNIHRFSYDVRVTTWINTIGFMNLSVVGLILSTFTTRFVFPMINLEGRRFWILSRLFPNRDTILWSKFLFAFVGSVIPCTLLILLNDVMLPIDRTVMTIHLIVCVCMCLGLSGIAVGLGARLLDLKQESPSKIATGFGGTMNLVISTLFLTAVIACTAIPCHYYVGGRTLRIGWALLDQNLTIGNWIVLGTATAVVLSVLAAVIPMRLGFRAFRQLEF
jgi:ABC-2 type transport system permease protein